MQNLKTMYPSLRENKIYHSFKSFGLKIIFFSILFIGCVYQTYFICHFYYSYPTIVSTETQFVDDYNELPAITICTVFDKMRRGSTLNETLNNIDIKRLIKSANIASYGSSYQNVTEEVLNSIVIAINSQFYCLTINPQLKGKRNNHIFQ